MIWSGSASVRVRHWPHQPESGFLLINGTAGKDIELPESSVVAGWLHTLSSSGFSHVRTNALSPDIAARLIDFGFSVAQDLVLLERGNNHDLPQMKTAQFYMHTVRVFSGRILPSSLGRTESVVAQLLKIDSVAFEKPWCLDRTMLIDALWATHQCRLFVATAEGEAIGFVLAGASGRQGYIQRLAVQPTAQRIGVASHLLCKALDWIDAQGCRTSVVNTDVNNAAALRLYAAFNYVALEKGLTVVERTLQ